MPPSAIPKMAHTGNRIAYRKINIAKILDPKSSRQSPLSTQGAGNP